MASSPLGAPLETLLDAPLEERVPQSRRFQVLSDGTVLGDDGEDGRLAASLRYATRLAGQVEYLLDVGDLEEFSTVSSRAITATVACEDDGSQALSVRIDAQPTRQVKVLTVVGGADVQLALTHCVQRLQQTPGVRWGAIVASDKRVVGACLPQSGAAVLETLSAMPGVGVRALAVLGSTDESLRESWMKLTYSSATVLVAAVGAHCLYAVVDDFKAGPFGESLDEVRAILSPYDLCDAETLVAAPAEVDDVAPAPVVSPTPVGMRYRAAQPKVKKERKRRLIGR